MILPVLLKDIMEASELVNLHFIELNVFFFSYTGNDLGNIYKIFSASFSTVEKV